MFSEAEAETTEFLDDVLEYFQVDLDRADDFEEWKKERDEITLCPRRLNRYLGMWPVMSDSPLSWRERE
jgi:hypothetical protein